MDKAMKRRAAAGGRQWRRGSLVACPIWLALLSGPVSSAENAVDSLPPLGVEGISAFSADDDPGVLYILPWQPPTLPRRPRARLDDSAPDLLEPLDPMALERHRIFRETLNPSMDSAQSVQ